MLANLLNIIITRKKQIYIFVSKFIGVLTNEALFHIIHDSELEALVNRSITNLSCLSYYI